MEQLINNLLNMTMEQFMSEAREELAESDEIYLKDRADERDLERRYEELDITPKQRMLINDYMACAKTANQRYVDISYIAGIKDALKMCMHLGVLKNPEEITAAAK